MKADNELSSRRWRASSRLLSFQYFQRWVIVRNCSYLCIVSTIDSQSSNRMPAEVETILSFWIRTRCSCSPGGPTCKAIIQEWRVGKTYRERRWFWSSWFHFDRTRCKCRKLSCRWFIENCCSCVAQLFTNGMFLAMNGKIFELTFEIF